jgi:hypothetical protein
MTARILKDDYYERCDHGLLVIKCPVCAKKRADDIAAGRIVMQKAEPVAAPTPAQTPSPKIAVDSSSVRLASERLAQAIDVANAAALKITQLRAELQTAKEEGDAAIAEHQRAQDELLRLVGDKDAK